MRRETDSQVVINGRFLSRRPTGVERHGREILRCLWKEYRVEATRSQGWRGHAWEQFILPRRLERNAVLWSPANTGPVLVRNQAVTIHDLSPLEHPEWFRRGFAVWYRLFLPALVRRVRMVFTPSSYIKQKVIRRWGRQDVIVTPNGVDRCVFHPGARQARFSLPARYVLFVGTLEPRKNLGLLLEAWDHVKERFQDMWLVLAGDRGTVFRNVDLGRGRERMCRLGYVDDATLAGLYAQATLCVLPSHNEGFGLPALEAMACGAPVLVSDGGALPEVVGKAGMTFCLAERGSLQNALHECLRRRDLRQAMAQNGMERAQQFSWQTTAEAVWKALHEI